MKEPQFQIVRGGKWVATEDTKATIARLIKKAGPKLKEINGLSLSEKLWVGELLRVTAAGPQMADFLLPLLEAQCRVAEAREQTGEDAKKTLDELMGSLSDLMSFAFDDKYRRQQIAQIDRSTLKKMGGDILAIQKKRAQSGIARKKKRRPTSL